MAQFRLSEMPTIASEWGLPAIGMLYFFYDMENQPWGYDPSRGPGHRVLFVNSESGLTRQTPPEVIEYDDGVLECHVTASAGVTLPGERCLPGCDEDFEAYWEVLDREPQHQLLGIPHEVQNSMELECQLASSGVYIGDATGYDSPKGKTLAEGASDWVLLFQMDTDDDVGVMWGDAGTVYYWIRRQDLAAARFDRTWLILQCH